MTYVMPDIIKNAMSYNFLKDFRDELFRNSKILSISSFADEISMFENTRCYIDSFKTMNDKYCQHFITRHYYSLDYFSSEIFCGMITNLLIENKLILNYRVKLFDKEKTNYFKCLIASVKLYYLQTLIRRSIKRNE